MAAPRPVAILQAMGSKVLVVDDDTDDREAEAMALDRAGDRPVCAGSGEEALDELRTTRELPQVILLDLEMPGMGGERFRAIQVGMPDLASVPVVIVSAHPSAERAASRMRLEFLAKPFDVDTLVDVVRRTAAA